MKVLDRIRKNKGTVRAAVYARFSSDNQRDESIDAQLRAIKEYAKRNDILIVEEYIDRAKSAMTDNRPEFLTMIKDAKKVLFDVVIVHKLDRFARNRSDSIGYRTEVIGRLLSMKEYYRKLKYVRSLMHMLKCIYNNKTHDIINKNNSRATKKKELYLERKTA